MSSTTLSSVEHAVVGAARSGRRRHHLMELEGIRALAALAVLLTHVGFVSGATSRHVLPGLLARLDFGVALFFVLSGFLLYRPHARYVVTGQAPATVGTYAARRAARLVPAWLAVLAGTLALVPASRTSSTAQWVANLLQLQSLRIEWDLPGLAQLWSLSTEVAFYAALPLAALVIGLIARTRGPRGHLLALGAVAAASWTFQALALSGALPEGFTWLRTLPAMGDWFVVGMVLAVVVSDPGLNERAALLVRAVPWHLYGIAACVFWVITTRIAGPYDLTPPTAAQSLTKHLGYAVVAGLVIAPSVLGARTAVSRVLSSRVLTYGGTISYGLFLWHLPILLRVREALGLRDFAGGFWSSLVATLAASVLVAALSWHLIEAPIQAWSRRRTTSTPPAPGPHRREGDQDQGRPSGDDAAVRG